MIPIAKQYIQDFEQLGFGVFVHFGLYSLLEHGEWSAKLIPNFISEAEYKNLAKSFNPGSMENMVLEIKKSGAKYITLTTRHHDGFSLYDTKGLSSFDAMHSAAKRDLVKEFTDACRKHDIVPFFYHTTLEWWHPDFENNFPKYLEYLRESVKLLCTNYGKIGGLWFDGNWSKTGEGDVWQEEKLYGMIRKYQPDAMIINNTGLSHTGELGNPEIDSVTFERGNPKPIDRTGMKKYVTGEVCDSVNMHWGIASKDLNFKSPKDILSILCKCRGAGANYLLNIGPDKEGNIPLYPRAILETVGKWMDTFGEAIYNGRPFWYKENSKNIVLRDNKHVYFVYFNLSRRGSEDVTYFGGSDGESVFSDFNLTVSNIRWMDNNENLSYKYTENNLYVNFVGYNYGTDYCVRIAVGDIID